MAPALFEQHLQPFFFLSFSSSLAQKHGKLSECEGKERKERYGVKIPFYLSLKFIAKKKFCALFHLKLGYKGKIPLLKKCKDSGMKARVGFLRKNQRFRGECCEFHGMLNKSSKAFFG